MSESKPQPKDAVVQNDEIHEQRRSSSGERRRNLDRAEATIPRKVPAAPARAKAAPLPRTSGQQQDYSTNLRDGENGCRHSSTSEEKTGETTAAARVRNTTFVEDIQDIADVAACRAEPSPSASDLMRDDAKNLRGHLEKPNEVQLQVVLDNMAKKHSYRGKQFVFGVLCAEDEADGRTPLMFAAFKGRAKNFREITNIIRRTAASKRSNVNCFREVNNTLTKFVGEAGRLEQLWTRDREGKSLKMYAARSGNVALFKEARDLCDQHNGSTADEPDHLGRATLHHAAEEGCADTIGELVTEGQESTFSDTRDRRDRTPLGCLLAKRIDHKEYRDLDDKFKSLLPTTREQWLPILRDEEETEGKSTIRGPLKLVMHAARGGRCTFEFALNKIVNGPRDSNSYKRSGSSSDVRHNDDSGGAKTDSGNDGPKTTNSDVSRLKQLFTNANLNYTEDEMKHLVAQAALGGDKVVLKCVFEVAGESLEDDNFEKLAKDALYPITPYDLGDCYCRGRRSDFVEFKSVNFDESLFVVAILSERREAMTQARALIEEHVEDPEQRWCAFQANKASAVGTLAYAASAPDTSESVKMFNEVFGILEQAAAAAGGKAKEELTDAFLLVRKTGDRFNLPPLAGAALCGNAKLFKSVSDKYYSVTRKKLETGKVKRQLEYCRGLTRKDFNDEREVRFLPRNGDEVARVPAIMWRTVVDEFDEPGKWTTYFGAAVQEAAEGASFEELRKLVRTGFLLGDSIPTILTLLKGIGDHESKTISTVMLAVKRSSNPLVMGAIVSEHISRTATDAPTIRKGLRELQGVIDGLTDEILDKLPRTVRGVGREIVGGQALHVLGGTAEERRRKEDRLTNLVGYITVMQILQPTEGLGLLCRDSSVSPKSSECLDPVQHAVDRGSEALYFVNAPVVLDFVHLMFSRTVPSWRARNPFTHHINEGLYQYFTMDRKEERDKNIKKKQTRLNRWWNTVLRLLQGWDHNSMKAPGPLRSGFPHRTVLPGLQFSLAGIIGKPDAFFAVPGVRFVYSLLSYIVMVGLFVWFLPINDSDNIPVSEILFYLFGAGLFWREILEFRDCVPRRKSVVSRPPQGQTGGCWKKWKRRRQRIPVNRVSTALKRYLFYDTWNILDTITILGILAAFSARLFGLGAGWKLDDSDDTNYTDTLALEAVFVARFFVAGVAPLLFSRLLFLSQIDDTLGPMTQIIWTMMSHLVRFSVFLLVIMTSFALTFYSLFNTCNGDLGEAFQDFHSSLLFAFDAMLGSPGFVIFDDDCPGPAWATEIGVFLLVLYLVIMAILLLNLLIAVLSTAHSEFYANAEMEYHLSRTKTILKTEQAVTRGRVPPPLNLLMASLGIVVDLVGEIWLLYLKARVWLKEKFGPSAGKEGARPEAQPDTGGISNATDNTGGCAWLKERLGSSIRGESRTDIQPNTSEIDNNAERCPCEASTETFQDKVENFRAFSETTVWRALEGGLHRLLFAITVGLAAMVLSAVLWVVSIPWIGWRIFRWTFPPGFAYDSDGTGPAKINRPDLWATGHVRPFVHTLVKIGGWILGCVAAIGFCTVCLWCSVLLWFRGILSIIEWSVWCWTCRKKVCRECRARKEKECCEEFQRCAILPGEENRSRADWVRALSIVREGNHHDLADQGSSHHYHLAPFLKMMTGLNLDDLESLAKQKRSDTRNEEGEVEMVARGDGDEELSIGEKGKLPLKSVPEEKASAISDSKSGKPWPSSRPGSPRASLLRSDDDKDLQSVAFGASKA